MKIVITVESTEPLTLSKVETCISKTFRRSAKRDWALGLEDGGKLDLAGTPVNPPASVRWEMFRSESHGCRACKAPVSPPYTLCAACADQKGA